MQITLHYDGVCHYVDNIECHVPTVGRIRKTAPRFVMRGKARYIHIMEGVAYIR